VIITTTKGDMDTSILDKREGVYEDDRARAEWVEYWLEDELVHRSVNIALKQGHEFSYELGRMG